MSFRLVSQGGLILCILLFSSMDEERVAKFKKFEYADAVNLFMTGSLTVTACTFYVSFNLVHRTIAAVK